MKYDSDSHLAEIKTEFLELVTAKYNKGQKEHGGFLWLKNGLLNMAIDEAIDQVVYLLTLKHQQKGDYFSNYFNKEDLINED